MPVHVSDGLEDVVAAATVLSEVDGQAGRLIIRGCSLDDLAGRTTYEEVVRLLWDGFFDDLPADLAPALGPRAPMSSPRSRRWTPACSTAAPSRRCAR